MKSGEEQCYYTEDDLNVVLEMSYFDALLLTLVKITDIYEQTRYSIQCVGLIYV